MVDLDTEICVCNSITLEEMARCIKKYNLTTLQEVLENNDGLNIPLVLSMVKQKKI